LRLEPIARHAAGTLSLTPENQNKRDKGLLSGTMPIPCWQPLESTQPHMPYGTQVTYHNRLGLCQWMEALQKNSWTQPGIGGGTEMEFKYKARWSIKWLAHISPMGLSTHNPFNNPLS